MKKEKNYVRIRYDDGYDDDVHVPHVQFLSYLNSDVFFVFPIKKGFTDEAVLGFVLSFLEVYFD